MLEMGWAGYVVTSCSICNVRAGLLLAGLQWLYISPWPLAGGHWLADTAGARCSRCSVCGELRREQDTGTTASVETPCTLLQSWRHTAQLQPAPLQRKQPTSDCSGCCSVRSEDREEYEPRPRPLSPPGQHSGPVTKNQYRHLPTVRPSHADTAH